MVEIKKLTTQEFKKNLSALRKSVQNGDLIIELTNYNPVIGFLVAEKHLEAIPVKKSMTIKLSLFRDLIQDCGKTLAEGCDCIYIKFHKTTIMAFVNTKFRDYIV